LSAWTLIIRSVIRSTPACPSTSAVA
jgi:hypothetical protein